MSHTLQGQVSRGAAEVYKKFFVPALFSEWAPRVADAARLEPDQKVLDVACGTGVLAREAAGRVKERGSVVGLDPNEGMLAVARRIAPAIEWRLEIAEALPFADGQFDAVVSQFGLMFFRSPVAGLREMWRLLRPGGRLAIAVWDAIDRFPGYAAMVALLQRLFGAPVADQLRAPFALGDPEVLRTLFNEAGIPGVDIVTSNGTARFRSLEDWLRTDVRGWTLADSIDDAQFETLLREAGTELNSHVGRDGRVAFSSSAHIATARKS